MAALPVAAFAVMVTGGAAASELGVARATVPFAFDLDGERMEAGRYVFEPAYGTWLVTARPERGKPVSFLGSPVGGPSSPREAKLVFYLVDGRYYLAEVWMAGTGAGKRAPVNKEIEFSARRGAVKRIEVAVNR
ncbi:MAG: hypothetical protein C0504_04780 [Candidatus Solibacter sp.]|nr:hypothetical protein [Candidatus Solibacter sp.]